MGEPSPNKSSRTSIAAYFGLTTTIFLFSLLPVVFIDVEMYRWFRRTHDPVELLESTGIAGAVTGAYITMLFPGGLQRPIARLIIGAIVGLNVGWLLLLIAGFRELMLLGLL